MTEEEEHDIEGKPKRVKSVGGNSVAKGCGKLKQQSRILKRKCAVTKDILTVSHLIRFVATPEGEVVPDLRKVLPGRGVWLRAQASVLEEAVKRRIFGRHFKRAVSVKEDLVNHVRQALEREMQQGVHKVSPYFLQAYRRYTEFDQTLKRF